jgi:hypothetical protein
MGCANLHRYGYTVLVAWTIVLGMDVYRPICSVVKSNKVNKNKKHYVLFYTLKKKKKNFIKVNESNYFLSRNTYTKLLTQFLLHYNLTCNDENIRLSEYTCMWSFCTKCVLYAEIDYILKVKLKKIKSFKEVQKNKFNTSVYIFFYKLLIYPIVLNIKKLFFTWKF